MSKLSNLSLVVTLLLSSLLFISCKKEKEVEESIVGKWKMENYIVEVEGDDPEFIQMLSDGMSTGLEDTEITYEFYSDGTWFGLAIEESSGIEDSASGTYSLNGHKITLALDSPDESQEIQVYDYTLDGAYLTLKETYSPSELEEMSEYYEVNITKMVIQQVLKKVN